MTRATFTGESHNSATLEFDDTLMGDRRRFECHAPSEGGYVRLYGSNGQICEGFARTGATMLWSGSEPLVDYLRREYRRMRAAERRERRRDYAY